MSTIAAVAVSIAFSTPNGTGVSIRWIRAGGTWQGNIVNNGHNPAWRQ